MSRGCTPGVDRLIAAARELEELPVYRRGGFFLPALFAGRESHAVGLSPSSIGLGVDLRVRWERLVSGDHITV